MARLIELHSKETDERVLINFDKIVTMVGGKDNTTIYFSDDMYAVVKESYDEITQMLDVSDDESLKKLANFSNIDYINYNIPDACKNCSNHPSNGGSGICFCTLGSQKVIY